MEGILIFLKTPGEERVSQYRGLVFARYTKAKLQGFGYPYTPEVSFLYRTGVLRGVGFTKKTLPGSFTGEIPLGSSFKLGATARTLFLGYDPHKSSSLVQGSKGLPPIVVFVGSRPQSDLSSFS